MLFYHVYFRFLFSTLLFTLFFLLFNCYFLLYCHSSDWTLIPPIHDPLFRGDMYIVAIAGHGVVGVGVLLKKEILQDVKSRE